MPAGDRIVLRAIKKDDIDTLFDLTRQYPDIDKHFPMSLLSELIVSKHFEPGDPGNESNACLLICLKPGDIIGSIAYFNVGRNPKPFARQPPFPCSNVIRNGHRYVEGVELAYHIFRPAHRGKGYMSEALGLMTAFLFETKNIPRIQINLEKGNIGSRKVAEKCGFTFDGTIRKAPRPGETLVDIEMFSLLREE